MLAQLCRWRSAKQENEGRRSQYENTDGGGGVRALDERGHDGVLLEDLYLLTTMLTLMPRSPPTPCNLLGGVISERKSE
ncbi:hypothetical protein MRB53_041932 [Persea americana]|nr:hypothetical protein MRB53_041932 [Persea americana]